MCCTLPVTNGVRGAILIDHEHFVHPREYLLDVRSGERLAIGTNTQPV